MRSLLAAATAALWAAVIWLARVFVAGHLEWTYVAEQSRVGAPWYYRLAGVWGGMEGSLLLFTAIVALAVTVAAWRAPVAVQIAALVTIGSLAAIDLALASPFGRERVPATTGFGLNPILEHPAMAIHPPTLYAGLAAAAGGAFAAVGASAPQRGFDRARPWLLASAGLLTAAMTIGAAWSYVEQGWGGYWAWDPVENTSLLVWLAAVVALHAAMRARPAVAVALCVTPWLLAIAGAALTRSGRTPSVHSFAEQASIGWALGVLTVATLACAALAVARCSRDAPPTVPDPRTATVVLGAPVIAIVVAGTWWPLVAGRDVMVHGEFFSRTVGPLALVALPFLALQLVRSLRQRRGGWSDVAHAGALVLVIGVGVSTFDRVATDSVAANGTASIAGVDVANERLDVGPGTRAGTEAVTAVLSVDGREYEPSLVVYPERGARLAEVAVRTGVWTDTHVVLDGADDDGTVVLTVHRRHGMWLVWIGASAITVATLVLGARRPGDRSGGRASRLAGRTAPGN